MVCAELALIIAAAAYVPRLPPPQLSRQHQSSPLLATNAKIPEERSVASRAGIAKSLLYGEGDEQAPTTLEFANEIARNIPCLRDTINIVAQDREALQLLQECNDQIRAVTEYLRPSAKETVRLALEVALLAHHGQARRSGAPFVTHPVAVAVILAHSNMEKATIVSGLLHDTVEDTMVSFEDIERAFGVDVRKIVEGETKVSKLPKLVRSQMADEGMMGEDSEATKIEEQVENMRSMFIAMSEDWRIVVVKLADRLHNMRTLQYMPIEKRVSIAKETLEIFSPVRAVAAHTYSGDTDVPSARLHLLPHSDVLRGFPLAPSWSFALGPVLLAPLLVVLCCRSIPPSSRTGSACGSSRLSYPTSRSSISSRTNTRVSTR